MGELWTTSQPLCGSRVRRSPRILHRLPGPRVADAGQRTIRVAAIEAHVYQDDKEDLDEL